jgi:lysophospholipase L1-like esterase
MLRRAFLGVAAAAVLIVGCGGPPAGPGPINPPPDPGPSPQPSPSPPPPTLRVTRILAFGDSMTAGTTSAPRPSFLGLDAGLPQSYPHKLQSLLSLRYSAQTISVFNAGWAGRRASEDRDRFADMVRENSPDLIVLLEGANDLNNIVGSTNAGIDFAVGSMEEMVKHAVARSLPIFVVSLPEQRPGAPNTANAALVPRYNDALRTMAGKKGAMFIDLYAQFPLSLIGQDGLHPTEAGYDKFAEIVLDAIRQQYETAPSLSGTRD